jgi:hypothetical protein
MARPKRKEAEDDFEEQAPGKDAQGGISDDRILETAKERAARKAKMDKERGEIGEIDKQFEEDGGLKKALKDSLKLKEMEPDQRADYLRSLFRYSRVLGLDLKEALEEAFAQYDLLDPVPGQKRGNKAEASNPPPVPKLAAAAAGNA